MTGPYRVLDKRSDGRLKLSDVYISQTPPCQQGSNCRDAEKLIIVGNFHILQDVHFKK